MVRFPFRILMVCVSSGPVTSFIWPECPNEVFRLQRQILTVNILVLPILQGMIQPAKPGRTGKLSSVVKQSVCLWEGP